MNVMFEVLALMTKNGAVISYMRIYSLVNATDIIGEHIVRFLGSKSKPQKQSGWRPLLNKEDEGVSDKTL
jgi:hypothetical protein